MQTLLWSPIFHTSSYFNRIWMKHSVLPLNSFVTRFISDSKKFTTTCYYPVMQPACRVQSALPQPHAQSLSYPPRSAWAIQIVIRLSPHRQPLLGVKVNPSSSYCQHLLRVNVGWKHLYRPFCQPVIHRLNQWEIGMLSTTFEGDSHKTFTRPSSSLQGESHQTMARP